MTPRLKPYPVYKNSGVPWLGDVPEHWKVRKQRQVVKLLVSNVDKNTFENEKAIRLCNYVDVYKHDRITERLHFMKATATKDEIDRFRLKEGDVLVTKDSESWNDIGVPALVEYAADDLICGYHLAILRPHPEQLIGGYLLRAIQSQGVASQYYVSANGVTRYGLTHQGIKNVQIPIPPLPEQHAIAHFLDHIDTRINRAIRAKRKLITLLNEQKQAIIHRTVTRGLDPHAPLRPSGVEWLGDIPAHWEVVRLGRHIDLITGFPFKSEGFSQNNQDIRLLRGINVGLGQLRWANVVYWPIQQREGFSDYELQVGDIVLGLDRPIVQGGIRVASVNDSDVPSLLLQRVARVRPRHQLDSDFLVHLITGKSFTDYLAPIFTGISVPHLSPEQVRSFEFALPSLDEQCQIVESLAIDVKDLEIAIVKIQREIDLIREYRTRLIADVVTGKLDVRAAAAALPQEPEEVQEWAEDESAELDEAAEQLDAEEV